MALNPRSKAAGPDNKSDAEDLGFTSELLRLLDSSAPDEKEPLFAPSDDKVYRHPTFYDIPEPMVAIFMEKLKEEGFRKMLKNHGRILEFV